MLNSLSVYLRLDMQHGDTPGIDLILVDANVVFIASQHLAHDRHVEGAAVVLIELLLQLRAIGGEVARLDGAGAAGDIQRIAAQEFVALGGDVAEARNDAAAAHQLLCRLAVARLRHRAGDAGAVDLVHEIMAQLRRLNLATL